VCKTFDPRRGPVLRSIDLDVPANSFFALLGPSGCGKSTLLRIIAGLETLDSGTIALNGEDITTLPANQRKVNTVFQNFALFPHLTVRDNIAFGLKARRQFEAKQGLFLETIESLELDGLEDRYPDQLSGGQQQRVALARALVNEPQVLLLDEPMSHLDEYLKAKVSQDLLALQRRSGTIFLMVTHDREEAMSICSCMAVLNKGRIAQLDEPDDLYFSPKSVFVAEFMGRSNIFDGSIHNRAVTLPFYSDGEPQSASDARQGGKILISPELIAVRRQKSGRRGPALSKMRRRLSAASVQGLASGAQDGFREEAFPVSLAANGDLAPDGGFSLERTPPDIRQVSFRKKGRLPPSLEVSAVVDQVSFRGYAVELQCSAENTGPMGGRSSIQVITGAKDKSWKKGDSLILSIKRKDLRVLEQTGA
jgi:spermidine/putrescine transport system ATP-binding protein